MPGGGRGGRKGEAGGLKAVCSGRLGRTLLQGHAGSKKRDTCPSAVPLTAAVPHGWALVPGFPLPTSALPWHSPGGSRDTGAGPTELYATLLLLKHRAQQVRWWETRAGKGFRPAGWEQGWVKPGLSLTATGWV